MESNTAWDQKAAPAISEDDVRKAVTGALTLVGQALSLNGLITEDSDLIEASSEQMYSVASVVSQVYNIQKAGERGSESFCQGTSIQDFANTYTNLAMSSEDKICDEGVSFADLNSFISQSFSDNA